MSILVEDCWYRDVCNKRDDCSASCVRFSQMKFLVENSNLPSRLCYPASLEPAKCDLEKFYQLLDIKNNIVQFVEQGQNLYLYSKNFGNGKTTWAAKLLLKYFNEVWPSNGFRVRGLFIPVTEFLVNLKQNITLKDQGIYKLYESIRRVDLVVWDDIGVTGASPMELEALYALINYRISSGLANIFTGNLDGDAMHSALGPRLCSRIWNGTIRVEFRGEDRRNNGFIANSK